MKKYPYVKWWSLWNLLIIMLLVGSSLQSAEAVERGPGFSSGIAVGAARFSDGDLGTGLSGRVFLEYAPYVHEIALRLSGGYLRFEDDITLGEGAFSSSENVISENVYLTGGLVYRLSRGNVVPFLTANLGIYHYENEDVSPAAGPIIDGVQVSPYDTVETLNGNEFGFNVGGGVEFFMGEKVSISMEALLHSIFGDVDREVFDATVVFRFFPLR